MIQLLPTKVAREGNRGTPKKCEPHFMTLRMNVSVHAGINEFCIENDVSQREVIEQLAICYLQRPTFKEHMVKRRKQLILEKQSYKPDQK